MKRVTRQCVHMRVQRVLHNIISCCSARLSSICSHTDATSVWQLFTTQYYPRPSQVTDDSESLAEIRHGARTLNASFFAEDKMVGRQLEDTDSWLVRKQALLTLSKFSDLTTHVAAVVAKLEDADKDVRNAALLTLGKLEPNEVAEHASVLVQKLSHSQFGVRKAAVRALGMLRPAALEAHALELIPMLKHAVGDVREGAAVTLAKLHPATLAQHAAELAPLASSADPVVAALATRTKQGRGNGSHY